MKIPRIILKPLSHLAGLHANAQLRAFILAHRQTARIQGKVLEKLIESHRDTAFGEDHGFANIRSVDQFRKAVPIRSYESAEGYFDRVLAGETTALIPPRRRVLMFSQTSGTTGKPKRIPVTDEFLSHIRRGWNVWGMSALKDHYDAWLRPILQISSPMQEDTSPTGTPCGAISGLLAAKQKSIVRRMYAAGPVVWSISDPTTKYYTTLRIAAERDIAFITTANPSSTIKLMETGGQHAERLIRDIADGTLNPPGAIGSEVHRSLRFRPNFTLARRLEEHIRRDGKLLGRHLWRLSFLANWTGGTLGLYLPRLRELFGDIPIRDIGLLASEGRFTVPLCDNTSAGVAEITGNFLEFIPADLRQSDQPDTLLAHELEVGSEYFLVITNHAGLWRYNLDDRVRVTGFMGQSPILEFLCRGVGTANITGEKLTEHQVVAAMATASERIGANICRFVLQGCFADTPYYKLELDNMDERLADRLAEELDRAMGKLNIEYRSKRSTGRLGPIKHVLLEEGEFDRRERETIAGRSGRTEQYKHQYLRPDILTNQPTDAYRDKMPIKPKADSAENISRRVEQE